MRCRAGFSLVELSIVLVILGLILGGVMVGQSLIKSSELRSTISETQRYVAAYNQFRDKYDAIPGDMPNATNYWGTATTCPGDSTHTQTTAATCNGDGNGAVDNNGLNEKYLLWKHMADAGLIEGTYTGVPASTSNTSSLAGTNCPKGKRKNVGYSAYYWQYMSGDPNYPDGQYGNFFFVGGYSPNDVTVAGTFPASEVADIDTKLDDGKPAFGKIRTNWNSTNCVTATATSSANYAVNVAGDNCIYLQLFQ